MKKLKIYTALCALMALSSAALADNPNPRIEPADMHLCGPVVSNTVQCKTGAIATPRGDCQIVLTDSAYAFEASGSSCNPSGTTTYVCANRTTTWYYSSSLRQYQCGDQASPGN